MKIGIFDPYLDDLGGGEKYMMMVATCLSKKHDVTIFWDNKEDIEAIKKRFDLSLENILINKDIFAPHVGFFERIKVSKKFDAIIVLSDGSIPFIYPTKLFLHIQQPLPRHIDSGFKSIHHKSLLFIIISRRIIRSKSSHVNDNILSLPST